MMDEISDENMVRAFVFWFSQEKGRQPTQEEIVISLPYFKWGWDEGFDEAQKGYYYDE